MKILKISGFVILGLAFVCLMYGIVHTWKNEHPIEGYATVTVFLTAIALFCISYAQNKEKSEKGK